MRRGAPRAALLAALSLAVPARASTYLFLSSPQGDWIGQGKTKVFTQADGVFNVHRNFDNGVSFFFDGGPNWWYLDFAAPMSATIVPGTYEQAQRFPFQSPTKPGLSVSGEGRGCNELSGNFVVHEATYDLDGTVLSFAADLIQHCENFQPGLLGSIRYLSGDQGCMSQPDGAPCDDQDPCSLTETCQSGVCAGDPLEACINADQCLRPGVCNPATGDCLSFFDQPDGTTCEDGNLCTVGDACASGECAAGPTAACDDGDLCTLDSCDPATGGCTYTARPCWTTAGTVTLKGMGPRQRQSFTGSMFLGDDGTFALASPPIACPAGAVPLPDESGTSLPGPRGRLLLRPDNQAELGAALSACLGANVVGQQWISWVKLKAASGQLRGTGKLVLQVHTGGRVRSVRRTTKFTGTLAAAP